MRFLLPIVFAMSFAFATEPYPAVKFPDASGWGKNIQRTMRLLATSTPEHRHTVRVLFYGQSITEQKWAAIVEADLRQRFPHANLIVENRALAGFSSQLLVKTAETDVESFAPDLVIFHVYGAHNSYEDIIRLIRTRTSAEILMQTDHVTKPQDFDEETDAAKLPPAGKHWDAFMNHNWLPSLAKKYGTELCDQRTLWKAYLKQNQLAPKALLSDAVHPNAHGEWLMAECVKAYLRYDPKLGTSAAEDWVKTLVIGQDIHWKDGKLKLDFEGHRLEAIAKPGNSTPVRVQINGKSPAEIPELLGFTRAVSQPEGKWLVKWPIIAPIRSEKPKLAEDWTLTAKQDPKNAKRYTYTVIGSKTGQDGEGASDQKFVSKSGRVVIEPADWNAEYAMSLAGLKPVPAEFTVKWKCQPQFVEEYVSPKNLDTKTESRVILAYGIPKGPHTLELTGSPASAIHAIRVYRAPGAK
ncbi:MAG: SGNH/GDSL hydrolase family protein [Fimbriiglobus sp.]